MTTALALATGITVATNATGYPPQQLPTLLMLRSYVIPTEFPYEEGVSKSPSTDHSDEPDSTALLRAEGPK